MQIKSQMVFLKTESCFSLIYISILTIILGFYGCAQKGKQEPDFLQDMVCQIVDLNVEFFTPLQITCIDGRLFVSDFHGERMIHEIKTEPFEWIHDFGARGKGPVEFIGPLLTWVFDSRLFVFDRRVFRLGVFDIMAPDHYFAYKKYHDLCDVILLQAVESTMLYGITKDQDFVELSR